MLSTSAQHVLYSDSAQPLRAYKQVNHQDRQVPLLLMVMVMVIPSKRENENGRIVLF